MKAWLGVAAAMTISAIAHNRLMVMPPHPSQRVRRIAYAISVAEGYWVPGSIPNRRHNPGDLTRDGVIVEFPTATEGWLALYRQVERMLSGKSSFYRPDMSIEEVARFYTATEQDAWARNVAAALGVDPGTKLEAV